MKEWLDEEIRGRLRKLEPSRIEEVQRIEQIQLSDDEVITRIEQINGILVEITKKEELIKP